VVLSAKVQQKEKVVRFPTAAKKAKRTSRRRFRLKGPAVVLLLVLGFVFYSFGEQMVELYNVRHEVEEIRHQMDMLQKKNLEMKKKVEYLQSDAYVERMAREKLSLIKPGEKIILEAKPGVWPDARTKPPKKQSEIEVH
jgi:cell division protein FtsB